LLSDEIMDMIKRMRGSIRSAKYSFTLALRKHAKDYKQLPL